jgi:ERCC4-type nuclease
MNTDRQILGLIPTVLIDTREQDPLPVERLPTRTESLYTGDYSVDGLQHVFAVERKSLDDLAGSLVDSGRERFERELHRLRGFRFARLLIVGTEDDIRAARYRSRITPNSVLGSLRAFEVRYDVPVVFEPDRYAAACLVEQWASYFTREINKCAAGV